jgi:hypothetical protein
MIAVGVLFWVVGSRDRRRGLTGETGQFTIEGAPEAGAAS